jgi:hypothetical protein
MKFPQSLNEFLGYCHAFYGKDGIYDLGVGIPDIQCAIVEYLAMCCNGQYAWGDGDSVDREHVRAILEDRGFYEINQEKC